MAGLGEPAEADEQRFPELEDENRHYDLAKTLPGEEPVFGSVAYTPEGALDWINTALKFDPQADKLEFFVKALKRDPNGNFAYTTGEMVPVEEHPDFKGKLIRPDSKEPEVAEETPEPEVGEESIPSDVLEKYRRLYDLYNEPGNTYNKTLKLSKQIEDLEIKYPELADLDLDSDAEDESEVEDLPEPEIEEPEAEKEPARMIKPTETPRVRDGEGKDVEIPEYELSLDPKSEKSKKALLDTIEKLQPEGDMDLYQRNLNKYLDRQVDRFYEEAQEKAPKAKSVKDKKKT